MRVLRVCLAGRDRNHRLRDRALAASGADVTLVVPETWPGMPSANPIREPAVRVLSLPVVRAGDVNRHRYAKLAELGKIASEVKPDILDIQGEPLGVATRQWLSVVDSSVPVVIYTAQNIDKRLPPPFASYEKAAFQRAVALYPCSRQAAAVVRGKGFDGHIEVLPLGYDETLFYAGRQHPSASVINLTLIGRLVPEKGVRDSVRVLERIRRRRLATLTVVGDGPELEPAKALAEQLGVGDAVSFLPWRDAGQVAALCRRTHVVLVPSSPTTTWVEQFGRVLVEGQASGAVVAGYATGAIPEVAGPSAVLTAAGDWVSLADGIEELLRDQSEYCRRREVGLRQSELRTWKAVAERQLSLYRRILSGSLQRVSPPASPKARRALAAEEFAPPAEVIAGSRPFALPVLRRGGRAPSSLGTLFDVAAETRARLGSVTNRSRSS